MSEEPKRKETAAEAFARFVATDPQFVLGTDDGAGFIIGGAKPLPPAPAGDAGKQPTKKEND